MNSPSCFSSAEGEQHAEEEGRGQGDAQVMGVNSSSICPT